MIDVNRNNIKITLAKTNATLFIIECKDRDSFDKQLLLNTIEDYYYMLHGLDSNIEVRFVPIMAGFTDIKVICNNKETILGWSFTNTVKMSIL